jgi:hypothetical protein
MKAIDECAYSFNQIVVVLFRDRSHGLDQLNPAPKRGLERYENVWISGIFESPQSSLRLLSGSFNCFMVFDEFFLPGLVRGIFAGVADIRTMDKGRIV